MIKETELFTLKRAVSLKKMKKLKEIYNAKKIQ